MESKENLIFTIHPLVPSFSGIFYHLPATPKKKTTRLQQWLILYHWNGPKLKHEAMVHIIIFSPSHFVISHGPVEGKWFFNKIWGRGLTSPQYLLHSKVHGKYLNLWRFFGIHGFFQPLTVSTWWLNQPIWKISYRQIGSFPKVYIVCIHSGENAKKHLKPPPRYDHNHWT